jgi:hypothetical protein
MFLTAKVGYIRKGIACFCFIAFDKSSSSGAQRAFKIARKSCAEIFVFLFLAVARLGAISGAVLRPEAEVDPCPPSKDLL